MLQTRQAHHARRRTRWALSITAAVVAAGAAVAGPLGTQAEQYNQPWGCAWTDGPTAVSTGCTYTNAFASVGSVEWVGGFTPATVTGATGTPLCAFLGGVGGVCEYTQTINSTITVSEALSTAGVAGTPQAAGATFQPSFCVWAPLTGGCSYTITIADGTLQGTVAYAGGAQPIISGTGVSGVVCTPSTALSGTCTFTFLTPGTVSVTAASTSAGIAITPLK